MGVIVVTGAGSGIGQAIAEALAADGHKVVVTGRTIDRLLRVAYVATPGAWWNGARYYIPMANCNACLAPSFRLVTGKFWVRARPASSLQDYA